jgi:hypothetical protein
VLSICRSIIITFGNGTSWLREGIIYVSLGKLHPTTETIRSTSKSDPSHPHSHRSESIQGRPPLIIISLQVSVKHVGKISQLKKFYYNMLDFILNPVHIYVPYVIKDLPRHQHYWSTLAFTRGKNHWNVKFVGNGLQKAVI